MSDRFRINGGHFYQQHRKVKGRTYGPYWYCKSGWGRVTHLGNALPAEVEHARVQQMLAADLSARLRRIVAVLNRFVCGDALSTPDQHLLAELGFTLPPEVQQITQAFVSRWDASEAQTADERRRQIAEEVLSDDERALLASLGFGFCASPTVQRDTNLCLEQQDRGTFDTNK